jgi:hypothetical protein
MSNLTTFRENPDFNSFFIVLRYQLIENPKPVEDLDVAYVVIGRFDEGVGYLPMPSSVKTVTFEVHDQHGEVKIFRVEPTTPFVSRAAAIVWLKSKLATQKDPAERAPIEGAIQALEAASKPAAPPK